jgi:hypothetical protein
MSVILLKDLLCEAITDNPNFKKWFGNSKVVDAQGKPLVVYHGTNQPIDKFDSTRRGASTANSTARKGFFFTSDKDESSDYADMAASRVIANIKDHEKKTAMLLKQLEQAEKVRNWDLVDKLTNELENHEINATREGEIGANVLPVYLSIQNPKIVNVNGEFNIGQVSGAIDAAKKEGNDGVILIDIKDSPKGNIRSTHYVVFKPTQIKSAIGNNGEFNPKSPYLTK